MKKRVALSVAVVAFLLLLGTAGASDADMLSFTQTVIRLAVSLVMLLGSVCTIYILERAGME